MYTVTIGKLYLLLNSLFFVLIPVTAPTDTSTILPPNWSSTSTDETLATNSNRKLLECNYAPGLTVGDRQRELECCDQTVTNYHSRWSATELPLSRYLAALKGWNCPQFQLECQRRFFGFTPFTELMYDYMCKSSVFIDKCLPKLTEQFAPLNVDDPDDGDAERFVGEQLQRILFQIQPAQMTIEELLEPCVQMAQYIQAEGNGTFRFQEVLHIGVLGCDITWCGFGPEAYLAHEISTGTCVTASCHTRFIIGAAIVCGFLGFATTITNILIIAVFCLRLHGQKRLLNNSQAVYKISLAVADLLVGVIVLPTLVVNLHLQIWTRLLPREEVQSVEGYEVINGTLSDNVSIVQKKFLAAFDPKFTFSYVNFSGFFSSFSIIVSVYILTGAGFDRLNAVAKPFTHNNANAFARAKRLNVALWIIAFILGILPVFIPNLKYYLFGAMIFVTWDLWAAVLYFVGLVIPLVIVWIVNVLIYYHCKKPSDFNFSMTKAALKKRHKVERRLASTLRLMVGVFTFNTLPVFITHIISLTMPGLNPAVPTEFDQTRNSVFRIVLGIAGLLLMGNSLCNFFIYSVRNREFRDSLKVLFISSGQVTKLFVCFSSTSLRFQDIARQGSSILQSSFSSSSNRPKYSASNVTSTLDTTSFHNQNSNESGSDFQSQAPQTCQNSFGSRS